MIKLTSCNTKHEIKNKKIPKISRDYTTDFESNTFLAFLKVMVTIAKVIVNAW